MYKRRLCGFLLIVLSLGGNVDCEEDRSGCSLSGLSRVDEGTEKITFATDTCSGAKRLAVSSGGYGCGCGGGFGGVVGGGQIRGRKTMKVGNYGINANTIPPARQSTIGRR